MKSIYVVLLSFFCFQICLAQNPMFDICPLKVGEEVPNVSLISSSNEENKLEEIMDDTPTVLVFYRGAWCGYCIKHLAELNDAKQEIEDLGFKIVGITLDQSSKLETANKKANSEIDVFSDSSAAAINAFGLDWKVGDELFEKYKKEYKIDLEEWSGEEHHSLPVPAIFIVKDGVVQFQYVNPNYNTRLKTETLLAILKTM